MMEFDIVDKLQDTVRTENTAMRLRVPEPEVELVTKSNDELPPKTTNSLGKPLTRLEKLLEEYNETPEPNSTVSNSESVSHGYMLSKMEFRGKGKHTVSSIKPPEMDLVTNMDDIDRLDDGKPWSRLDNWTKKSKLKEFARGKSITEGLPIQDTMQELLDLYENGHFHKKHEVEYDTTTNKIISLKSV
jgi:hypothetical protein